MRTALRIKKYDLSILSMFKTITSMTAENRDLLLKEMDVFAKKIQLRATRQSCNISIEFVNSRGTYTATVENISTTGAFIACRVPVLIDEKIYIHFGKEANGNEIKLQARIVHSAVNGFGVQFFALDAQSVRFLQACVSAPLEDGATFSAQSKSAMGTSPFL